MNRFLHHIHRWLWTVVSITVIAALPARAECIAKSSQDRSGEGYEITAVRWDPVLKRRWAVAKSCDRKGAPPLLLATKADAADLPPQSMFVAIHAGDLVRITEQDAIAHMNLVGIAEENGVVGGLIRVHLLRSMQSLPDTQQSWNMPRRTLRAIVRAPHEVEIKQ